jgi:hypothetical protein
VGLNMKTLKDITNEVFYNMENHCQIVIDMVDEVQTSDLTDPEVRGSLSYDISNLLEVIDKSRTDDVKVLIDLHGLIKTF